MVWITTYFESLIQQNWCISSVESEGSETCYSEATKHFIQIVSQTLNGQILKLQLVLFSRVSGLYRPF